MGRTIIREMNIWNAEDRITTISLTKKQFKEQYNELVQRVEDNIGNDDMVSYQMDTEIIRGLTHIKKVCSFVFGDLEVVLIQIKYHKEVA